MSALQEPVKLTPPVKREKSKLELLEESLSSIIDNMSFSSHEMDHSAAIFEAESKQHSTLKPNLLDIEVKHNALNIPTPVQVEFNDIEEDCANIEASVSIPPNFEQLLSNTGYSSYITDFQQTGVTTLTELIRFATQYLPPSINITPAPDENNQNINSLIDHNNKEESKIEEEEQKQIIEKEETETEEKENKVKKERARTGRNKKHKLRLYEVEELLEDDEYCEYALLIRDGGNALINGYYTCSGKKNDHYMFNHMNDNLAALYAAKNGTWMIVYDDELLYGNPLKCDSVGGRDIMMLREANLYPPPPRCWYAIEAINPPPGVMWIEITDDPMAFVDDELAARTKEYNLNEKYMNKLKVDLPVQMIDFMFCGAIGFALRIDADSKVMDVIRIRDDGQAKELGLMHGDTLLRINEEEISTKPEIAFPLLKECVLSQMAFEVTFLRKKFDELVINVQRAGSAACNGKYVFLALDETDAPVFVKDNDPDTWRILQLDHDDQQGQSIWAIQNIVDNSEYYIGYSETYSPPNNSWETVEEVAKNPAPGLQFIAIDNQVMNKLVADEPKIRQNIFVPTKRRRKGGKEKKLNEMMGGYDIEDGNLFGDDQDLINTTPMLDVSLNSFKLAILQQQQEQQQQQRGRAGTVAIDRKMRSILSGSVSVSPRAHSHSVSSASSPRGINVTRTDSIMSTASIFAIPDEVQNALQDYQTQITSLEQELKVERRRALTLSHQHKTQQTILKEHEEKLETEKEEFTHKMEWFRDELYTVNNSYYELWIKQSDAKLDYHKTKKENHKLKGKFAQTKKQLFQAKRKIDDLEDDLDETQRDLDEERLKNGDSKNGVSGKHFADKTEQDLSSLVSLNKNLDILELQTEIASLKAQLASKDILIEELNEDNDKWQEAHDSIFERMTEAQTRLAKEMEEFEEAKKFYENKLSILRDKIQDNSIQFWLYEKRIKEITQRYEEDVLNGKTLPFWENQPKMKIHITEEKRISITLPLKNHNNNARDSILSMSGDWSALTPRAAYQQDDTLYDETEPEESDQDANNAFGGFTTTFFDEEDDDEEDQDDDNPFAFVDDKDDNNKEIECEEDDDGANAFAFGGS